MDRRQFLLGASASWATLAYAEEMAMAHHGRPMVGDVAQFVAPDLPLPTGQPLQSLPRLPLTAAPDGSLKGRLIAAPHTQQLLPGKSTTFWAYNGQLPGPLIDIAAGSTLDLHFENRLPQPSTIHWHGLPVPADQDGLPQDAVAPGDQRRYRFTLPADFSGTCWYHPHPHHHTAEQVFRGLAGAFIIRQPNDPLAHLPEHHLLISDLRLDADALIPTNTAADWLDGREGQFVLVNGQLRPELKVAPGSLLRLRIWNATSARQLRLALPGASWYQVGTDGGLIERPQPLQQLHLAPAERAEVVVRIPAGTSAAYILQALPYARGKMVGREQEQSMPLMQLVPHGQAVVTPTLPEQLRQIPPLPAPVREQRVLMAEKAADGPVPVQFLINGRSHDPERIDLYSVQGETEQWEIINGSDMDHPFHIHGAQFQLISRIRDGEETPEPWLAWRDTVNLTHAERVKLRIRQDLPGLRMFHCHILEHETLGMMGNLMVKAAG